MPLGDLRKEVENLKKKNESLKKRLNRLEEEAGILKRERDTYRQQIEKIEGERDEARRLVSELEEKIETLTNELREKDGAIGDLMNENQKLRNEIEKAKKERPTITIDELGKSLKNALASIHEEMSMIPERGGLKYMVDSFSIEIRSGIQADKKSIKLVQPKPEEITPEVLSTIRFSIKALPTIKMAKSEK